MKKSVKTRDKVATGQPKRQQRMVCLLSDEEVLIVNRYLSKYKISNKGRWLRETILGVIHRTIEDDYPTLFNEHEMRR